MTSESDVHGQETKGIPNERVFAAFSKAYTITEYSISDNLDERHELRKKTISDDISLTDDEKSDTIKLLSKRYDYDKVINNEGIKRICENCAQECLATLYCEHCVRNYLEAKFSNWTSNNPDIDDLIQKCQLASIGPNKIIEWIPYNNLENVKYFTKGGFSEIYSAVWKDGHYNEWNSEKKQLERHGEEKVIVKRLENVKNADRS